MSEIRVLGRRRLSREQVASTSMDRQEGYVTAWCEEQTRTTGVPHVVIGWADDVDVSGSVDPFKTPGLGPWLTDERATEWDVLCCWKIDRLSRTTLNSYKLLTWCKERGKRIKATNDEIDPDSRVGELLWFILSWLGQGELEAIKDRTKGTREHLIYTDRWPGGRIPYGYRQEAVETGEGYRLVPDQAMVKIIQVMYDLIVFDGYSYPRVAKALNEMRVPTPYQSRAYKSKKSEQTTERKDWVASTVKAIMRSQSLLGIREHNKEVVLDKKTGLPVRFSEPLISLSAWADLQEALNRKAKPGAGQQTKEPVYGDGGKGVAVCGVCGNKQYRERHVSKGTEYSYYRCSTRTAEKNRGNASCGNAAVRQSEVWDYLESYLMEEIGDKPWDDEVVIPASDNTELLKESERALTTVLEQAGKVTNATVKAVFDKQIEALSARITELSAQPNHPRRVEYVSTGKTFREHWATLTESERETMLSKYGIYVKVLRWPGELTSPENRPDLPVIDFGGIRYALAPKTSPRATGQSMYHVVLGQRLRDLLNRR